MIELKKLVHYFTDDPEFEGEYTGVSLYVDGNLVQKYGDHYHDKGWDKADGFIDGFQAALSEKVKIVRDSIADYDW